MTEKLWKSLGSGIYCVDAGYIKPGIACCYLIVEAGEVAIVETGTSHTVPTIMSLLAELNLSPEAVRYIIPTHVHLDHAGGAGVLMEQCPNAELVIHPRGARHMADPEKLVAGTIAVYGEKKFAALYGDIPPVDSSRIIAAEDGRVINLNGRMLDVRDTPGHADHHFCIWDEQSKGWFSGDTFGISYQGMSLTNGRYIIPTTTPVQFNPDKLVASVQLLMSYRPERFYLTHYGMVESAEALATQLMEQIEQMAALALRVEGGDNTEQMIERGLQQLVTERAAAIQPDFNKTALADLLAMDVHLNAQGLAVWLERRKGVLAKAGRT
ncbi:MAG: MBL fold metallo-hydrolase [Porticoccaceae bacterium]|nr:MBL fold metallo-hydrolase [Pseudomonadales bacterium]MCP5172823.1 MBL fold metallo-hydrolase [Pseudomonadales bacterium]MCP5302297.1 MBL fold metallo-hydrolase [Pseudomonadales bacterium]